MEIINIQPSLDSPTKEAIVSACGNYRYSLSRIWDSTKPKVVFIMLNPSTADAQKDDPTIRRCVQFAKQWGYGGILVGNLFAYRSTEPKILLSVNDPIGEENINHLKAMYNESKIVVCAWGNSQIVEKLIQKFGSEYKPLDGTGGNIYYLELAKDGTPKHPLYLKGDLIPSKF